MIKNVKTVVNFTFNSLIICLLCTQDVPSFDLAYRQAFLTEVFSSPNFILGQHPQKQHY